MDHLAIMNKYFLDKILCGQKKIESRWNKQKRAPFGHVQIGDRIYFKYSSGKVIARATVTKVDLFYMSKNYHHIEKFVIRHSRALGFESIKAAVQYFHERRNTNYVTFIHIAAIEQIAPFHIDKTGYGVQASWICVENIEKIRRKDG